MAGTALVFAIAAGVGFLVALAQRRSQDRPWDSLRAFRIARSALPVAVVSALAVAALLIWDLRMDYRTKEFLDAAAPVIPLLALAAWAVCHRLMRRRAA
jgi:hypothetical protein